MIITLAALSHSFFEYVALDARREGGLLSMHAHATFPHDGIVLRQSDTSMSKSRREVGPAQVALSVFSVFYFTFFLDLRPEVSSR